MSTPQIVPRPSLSSQIHGDDDLDALRICMHIPTPPQPDSAVSPPLLLNRYQDCSTALSGCTQPPSLPHMHGAAASPALAQPLTRAARGF